MTNKKANGLIIKLNFHRKGKLSKNWGTRVLRHPLESSV